ncbi:MAG: lamin tail domain-containing protein [Thaumarchaeota archaeon]|nr:lamin tail domain-containing protein [Nitrososphaerota archaeon]MDE1830931.1 lamin tail domain-containing protein [Nitrososphaerota archaeon]MDE1840408.1 lamin tail domain-containing protein [Nitrososphaerota archaeon]MDE1877407.1 lamin tail domain-containing protein [Nitrososphaerota archaeon]
MKYSSSGLIAGIILLLVIGQSYSVNAQTPTIANHVVINEAEINPAIDDTKFPAQWVELYNPTSSPVNIGGWTIGATTGLRQVYTISAGTTIQSQQFIVYHYVPIWFPHAGAVIQLTNPTGTVIDQTPPLSDTQGDGNTWQRMYDGLSTGSVNDWVYNIGTPGFSNGKPPTTSTTTHLTMSVSTDKQSYVFGDFVNISGKVSQLVMSSTVSSIPQIVNMVLSGPQGFKQTFSLYPGNDLTFSQSVKTDQVLGFSQGTYTISASYGGVQTSTTFSLNPVAFVPPTQAAQTTLVIYTDHSNYTTSQPVILLGTVSNVIPLTPVQYKVYDPTNVLIYQGNLFPDAQGKITSVNPYQSSTGSSGLLINGVNPVYGIYRVSATYGGTSATTIFTLVPAQIQTSQITLSTDKPAYAPGETVTFKGSTLLQGLQNAGLGPTLQIIQTGVGSSYQTSTSVTNAANVKIQVNLKSDNTFSYQFVLSGTSSSLGNYRAIISIPQGSAESDFVVMQNPSAYNGTTSSSPFTIVTDKSLYAIGDPITISGQILHPIQISTQNSGVGVSIQVLNSTGMPVTSAGSLHANISTLTSNQTAPAVTANALSYSAFPDANGRYQLQQIVQTGVYQPGNYMLKASYLNLVASTTFTVYDPLATGSQGPIAVSTDKKVYGVGDTVQLTGNISAQTSTSSFTLTLIKPDGEQITSPLILNNGHFSWTWTVASTASQGVQILTDRSSSPVSDPMINVYGIYHIKISSANVNSDLFFQVSKNPQPNQDIAPLVVMTDKTNYASTDVAKIWGEVVQTQNIASQETNTAVRILIYSSTGQEIYRGNANVNQGGQYYATVPFHIGIWHAGVYKLYVQYLTNTIISSFTVYDQFTTSSTGLQVFMTTDSDKYLPGQTVLVTGRTSSIVSVNNVNLSFGIANDTTISEGQVTSIRGNVIPTVTVPFDQFGSFNYDYKIPGNAPLGNYTIIAQVPFGTYNAYFSVVDKLPVNTIPIINKTQTTHTTGVNNTVTNSTLSPPTIAPYTIGPTEKPSKTANMFVEKMGQLSESVVPINLGSKPSGNATYYPQELDGLLRVNPGDVNSVSLKVSSQDGTCIIGQDQGCKISGSTVQSSGVYQTEIIGGMQYLVGYSGTGGRLAQFSIMPAHTGDVMPDGQWSVQIIKKDQVTRFYYQVTYISK